MGGDTELKRNSSGVVVNESNADYIKDAGEKIINMKRTFHVRLHIFAMNDKATLKIEAKQVKIDPRLLFLLQPLSDLFLKKIGQLDFPLSYPHIH